MSGLDLLRASLERRLPDGPVTKLTGLRLSEVGLGMATAWMPASEWWQSGAGVFLAGTTAFVADLALGGAVLTSAPPGMGVTTSELSVSFLRVPTTEAETIIGHGRLIHATRSLGLATATLEERMEDVHAVLDACGSQRTAIFGLSEGGPMSLLFAATYPERTTALITFGSFAKLLPAPHYFWERREGVSYAEDVRQTVERIWDQNRESRTRSKTIGAKARRSRCTCPASPAMRMRRGCSACSSARRPARRWSERYTGSTPRSTSPKSCP